MPLVSLQGVSFSYDGMKDILTDINCAIPKGQNLLVVGDNGSGKSTLGRLMAGLMTPVKGSITIDGKSPSEIGVKTRCAFVSYMGQVSHLSVLKSSISGELRSFSHEADLINVENNYKEWALQHALPSDLDENPRDLTTPDLWRLVLGLYAVILQPTLLIVDEIFCAGNKQQQDCLSDVLERRKQQGLATVALYQRNLPSFFDTVVTLDNNRISPF